MENQKLIRLQKYIADCGIASRRKAEEMILHNKIMVNQVTVNELGFKINPEVDTVTIEGKEIKPEHQKVYILLNKPVGYVTTSKDQFNRATVIDLVKDVKYRVYPVGRLDYDTSGLLLLTNDGDLANRLMHPKFEFGKTYLAEVAGQPVQNKLDMLRKGISIEDYITSPAKVNLQSSMGKNAVIKIIIHEGKNRQVRKMFDSIGHKVIKLKRIALGKIELGGLKEGSWRYLTPNELDYLKNL